MTWLIIGGLLLVNASVFLGGGDDPLAMRRFLHHFNPQHWPGGYAANFWLVFASLLPALILKNDRVQAALHSFKVSRPFRSS
jgi:hypothetical protein